ncbi:hypothetical protein B296_00010856 [Ensete ventricosum]|uniref:Uncharacterized protein n=1 Tax=Ensete ventricosum TaxID=4639 RepID=A0A427AH61_ENSVE|nr:hypothetical protein B296_00010856 [Ensete ventricosum]
MHSTPFLLRCASPPLRLLLHHLRLGCSPGIAWFPRPIPCPCIHRASDWTRKNRNIDPGIGNRLVKAEEEGAGGVEQQAGGGAKEEEKGEEKGEQRHGHPKKLMTDGRILTLEWALERIFTFGIKPGRVGSPINDIKIRIF